MPKKINIPEDELRELVKRGLSKKHLAEYYKCTVTTITNKMKAYGITYEDDDEGGGDEGDSAVPSIELPSVSDDGSNGGHPLNESVVSSLSTQEEVAALFPSKVIVEITKLTPTVKYEIKNDGLVLYNNSGETVVSPSSLAVINTGIGVKITGGVGIIRLLDSTGRFITITNPIVNDCDEVSVVIANYHSVDTYAIKDGVPVAVMNVITVADVDWREI